MSLSSARASDIQHAYYEAWNNNETLSNDEQGILSFSMHSCAIIYFSILLFVDIYTYINIVDFGVFHCDFQIYQAGYTQMVSKKFHLP